MGDKKAANKIKEKKKKTLSKCVGSPLLFSVARRFKQKKKFKEREDSVNFMFSKDKRYSEVKSILIPVRRETKKHQTLSQNIKNV